MNMEAKPLQGACENIKEPQKCRLVVRLYGDRCDAFIAMLSDQWICVGGFA